MKCLSGNQKLRVVVLTGWVMSLSMCMLNSGRAETDLRPVWSTEPVSKLETNSSFYAITRSEHESTFVEELLDHTRALELKQEYEDLNRGYEMRQNYNLVDLNEEQAQTARMADFSRSVVSNIRHNQTNKNLLKVRSAVSKNEDIKKPLGYAVAAAAVTTGYPVDATLGSETKIRAAANIPYELSYLQIFSPLGTGSISASGDPNASSKLALAPPSWVVREERFHVSFSRGLPVWDLGTGLNYGSTSNTIGASLSKPLHRNLTASLSTVRPMDSESIGGRRPEETLSVNYELRF